MTEDEDTSNALRRKKTSTCTQASKTGFVFVQCASLCQFQVDLTRKRIFVILHKGNLLSYDVLCIDR